MACVFCNTKRHTLTQQKLQLKPSFQRDQSLCLEDHKTNFVLFFNISLAYHYYHVSNFIGRYHAFFTEVHIYHSVIIFPVIAG